MAYTQNEKSTGLDTLTDLTLASGDLHIVGDVSDSGRAKAITQDLLEDYIANSTNFINELTANATFVSNLTTIAPAPLTTKGDIYTYSTTADRLPVGTNGQVLSADSTTSTGLKWIAMTGGGGGGGTKLEINTTAFTHTGDLTETTMFTVNIPGGTLGTNDAIRFYILGSADGNSDNVTFRTKYGGSTVATIIDASGTSGDFVYSGMVVADGATNAQVSSNQYVKDGNVSGASDGTDSSVDSTANRDLVITMQLSDAGGTVTAKGIVVEVVTGGADVELVAGENITDGDALAIASGTSSITFDIQASGSTAGTNNYEAQTFLMPFDGKITSLDWQSDAGAGTDSTVAVSIYATTAGVPTGSALVTSSNTAFGGNTTFPFTGCPQLYGGTTYAIVMHFISAGSGGFQPAHSTSGSYADGVRYTSPDGTTWTVQTGDDQHIDAVVYTLGEVGRVYKTDANFDGATPTDLSENFIGFATQTISKGSIVAISVDGVNEVGTGLSVGLPVYLSNTAGAVASSAGTVSKTIGLALSDELVLIKNDN